MCSILLVYIFFHCLSCYSELSAAGNSRALAGIIARNVEKTVKLFNMKCEQAVSGRGGGGTHTQTLLPSARLRICSLSVCIQTKFICSTNDTAYLTHNEILWEFL